MRRDVRGLQLPMRIWDLPIRLFHWIIVLLIALSYLSVRNDFMRVHLVSGYAVLALLLFRVIWGFIGSDTARFGQFLRSPLAAFRHLRHFTQRTPDIQVGHNEAGGWMVLVLLAMLAIQVGTGLCANDDGNTEGPLAKYVGKANSDWLSGLHALSFTLLLILIGLHILAVIAYAAVRRHDLIRPMITGKKRLPAATPAPRMVPTPLALMVVIAAGLAVWLLATRA